MITYLNFINLSFNVFFILKYLHIYQLKDYNFSRFFKFFINFRLFYPVFCLFLILFQIFFKNFIATLAVNLISIIANFIFNFNLIETQKTPLKYTPKIKRLYLISVIILLASLSTPFSITLSNFSLLFLPAISNFINIYDKIKNKHFIKSAQQKLKKVGCKIIAITGSNGKTSVKNILYEILITTYKTQATPKSFNTPLGISKFINEQLNLDTEFLILEYGARNKKDIQKLCKTFGADYGIVTTVSPQHLQTFKSIENVFKTKQELSIFLQHKLCIFNLDNLYTLRMFYNKPNIKIGTSIFTKTDISASNIYIKNFKTYFTLNINNKSYKISTQLLGEHNILNITLATSLAFRLNIPINKILSAIKKLKPISHRLEYIKGKINILDDSYNCSLSSAKQAIKVLSTTKQQKIIATPGIIEGGKNQYNLNFELGKLCTISDKCIIIGETNKKSIHSGMISCKYNERNIIFCKTLEEAKTKFTTLNKGDTLLLLNDLPDDYK